MHIDFKEPHIKKFIIYQNTNIKTKFNQLSKLLNSSFLMFMKTFSHYHKGTQYFNQIKEKKRKKKKKKKKKRNELVQEPCMIKILILILFYFNAKQRDVLMFKGSHIIDFAFSLYFSKTNAQPPTFPCIKNYKEIDKPINHALVKWLRCLIENLSYNEVHIDM